MNTSKPDGTERTEDRDQALLNQVAKMVALRGPNHVLVTPRKPEMTGDEFVARVIERMKELTAEAKAKASVAQHIEESDLDKP